MRVLVACEYSGTVRDAFAARGHEAWSCDILPSESDGGAGHIQGDAIAAMMSRKWDLMIAHPPCTYLSVVGNMWLNKQPDRRAKRDDALRFFLALFNGPVAKVCCENPMGFVNSQFRGPDQTINPYQFGDSFKKRTCLWLKELPPLLATHSTHDDFFIPTLPEPEPIHFDKNGVGKHWCEMLVRLPKNERAKARSKTFPGIARAMAEQWG